MDQDLVANASITISAQSDEVWDALVSPQAIKKYMFGADVITDWHQGSPIVWKGVWEGKTYEDKGKVLEVKPGKKIKFTHFSPLAGVPDRPENYHNVTIELSGKGKQTRVALTQDNNATARDREHSEENWKTMLDGLKRYVEGQESAR